MGGGVGIRTTGGGTRSIAKGTGRVWMWGWGEKVRRQPYSTMIDSFYHPLYSLFYQSPVLLLLTHSPPTTTPPHPTPSLPPSYPHPFHPSTLPPTTTPPLAATTPSPLPPKVPTPGLRQTYGGLGHLQGMLAGKSNTPPGVVGGCWDRMFVGGCEWVWVGGCECVCGVCVCACV